MKVEIPELKRCCCCVPLRYGLIAWGYIKSVVLLLLISSLTFQLIYVLYRFRLHYGDILFLICFLLMLVVDFCLSIVFIVGGHRKSPKLLHIYYIFNIVLLVLYMLMFTGTTAIELGYIVRYHQRTSSYQFLIPYLEMKLVLGIFILGVQSYVIILIRSEVNKLRNCSSYRFSNLRAQAEGALENGFNQQDTGHGNEARSNENAIDNQLEGIIDQTKESDQNSFTYKKF